MRLVPWWLWVMAASALLTAAVYYSIPAHADPGEQQVTNYAAWAAPAVCSVIDDYPTLPGVAGVVTAVAKDSGFTLMQAAEVVALAVQSLCPRHIALFDRFVATYTPPLAVGLLV